MNDWWAGLQQRERWFVGGLGAFIILSLIYLLLIEPLFDGANSYAEQAQQAELDLVWMQQNAARAKGRQLPVQAPGDISLLAVVDRTSKRFDIAIDNNQSVGTDAVRVQVKEAPFDKVVAWLGELNARYSVDIDAANISQGTETGTANASLTLRRSGSSR